jgi:hypothetical protein
MAPPPLPEDAEVPPPPLHEESKAPVNVSNDATSQGYVNMFLSALHARYNGTNAAFLTFIIDNLEC